MGKEDVYASDYLENAEVFADLVNGVLYHGEQVVKPEELSEQDGELRSILGDHVKKTVRYKVKLWNGAVLAVLAVENQTRVDYRMVTRAMLSESMAYDKQWKNPFISDYHLNLFDYHEYEEFGQFHSELQSVFEFLRYSGDKEQMKKKLEEHKGQYEELSRQAKVLLAKLTNIKKIPGVSEEAFEKGEFSMCKAFEDMKEEGKIEGKIEGRSEERENGIHKALNIVKEFGGSKEQGITSLIKEYKLSKEGAMEKVALYW